MKWKIRSISNILFAVLVFVANANAELVDNGNGTITDTDTNLMWLQDANYSFTSGYDDEGRMNWYDAMSWADTLIYAGLDDWRLPTTLQPDVTCDFQSPSFYGGYNCTGSEMGHMYYIEGVTSSTPKVFQNVQFAHYSSSTVISSNQAFDFGMGTGMQGTSTLSPTMYPYAAWAVRDIAIVPEPISSVLFVTGGSLLAGRSFLRKKRKA